MAAQNTPFTFDKDGDKITFTGGTLVPGGGNIQIVDGSISGLTDGQITDVEVQEIDGTVYKYQVLVVGDESLFTTGMKFDFTDETNGTYHLGIDSPVVENHYVAYNSDKPTINKIVLNL